MGDVCSAWQYAERAIRTTVESRTGSRRHFSNARAHFRGYLERERAR